MMRVSSHLRSRTSQVIFGCCIVIAVTFVKTDVQAVVGTTLHPTPESTLSAPNLSIPTKLLDTILAPAATPTPQTPGQAARTTVPISTVIDQPSSSAQEVWPWMDFWVNFLSNLLSSTLLAIALYLIITQPSQKNAEKKRRLQFLGMLESELKTNYERALRCIELLQPIEDVDGKPILEKIRIGKFSDLSEEEARSLLIALPRYTRGVWNALKENGFLTQIDDVKLVYYLFRSNEALVVAGDSRIKLRNRLLEGVRDVDAYTEKALIDSRNVIKWLNAVLPMLQGMKLPVFLSGDLLDNPDD